MFDVLPTRPDLDQEPPLDEVTAEDVVDDLTSLFARRDRLDAQIAARLRRAGETEAFRRDGYSSLSALLRHRMSLHPGEAHRLVTRANGLAHAPLVGIAFEGGALSGAGVDALLDARSMAPDAFAADEADLVALAVGTALVTDLRRQLDYWLDGVASDAVAADRELVREQRSLTLRRDGEMVRIAGWVDVEAGERLRAVLDPGPPAEGDTRSTPARRADVLLDVVNGASGRPGAVSCEL
jgi:hypothetical protein